jgi:hypothetical protein
MIRFIFTDNSQALILREPFLHNQNHHGENCQAYNTVGDATSVNFIDWPPYGSKLLFCS